MRFEIINSMKFKISANQQISSGTLRNQGKFSKQLQNVIAVSLLIIFLTTNISNVQAQPTSNSTQPPQNSTNLSSGGNQTNGSHPQEEPEEAEIDPNEEGPKYVPIDTGYQPSVRVEDNYFDPVMQQEMQEKYGNGNVRVHVRSIEPEAGPTEGDTRVLVRGGPFHNMVTVYPHPKCRFGRNSRIVQADYVACSVSPIPAKDFEKAVNRNETCLQCDNSPEVDKGEIVPLTVSLIGDFSDAAESVAYRYYKTPVIYAIQPRLGYKDGDTRVTVWGEGFLNMDELSVCNFGTESVKAEFINSTRLLCISPRSDVVSQALPFSVSFNKQQTTKQNISYWFYNRPQIDMVVPNIGSDAGGYPVTLFGQNLHPILPVHNYTNTTFCLFSNMTDGLSIKSKGTLIDSTHIICDVPRSNGEVKVSNVNITLNDQQYTEDLAIVYFFKTPIIYDIDPREGPTKGGTEVLVFGDRFNASSPITCKFGNNTTRGKFISTTQIKCISPKTKYPGPVKLYVSNGYERYSSSSSMFTYYETPYILAVTPICGPTSGYTQITVFGKNFRNIGFGRSLCIFNDTIYTNATIMDEGTIKCDSPVLLASMASTSDSISGPPFYYISITLDSGKSALDSNLIFQYYRDPVINSIEPNRGHMRGGTFSALNGLGFKQEAACNVTVRYGAVTLNITNVTNFTDGQINITSPPSNVPARVIVSIALNGQQYLNDKYTHLADRGNIFTYYQDSYITDYSPKSGPSIGKTLIKVEGMGFVQFRDEDGNKIVEPMWIRMRDYQTGELIGEEMIITEMTDERFQFRTPPAGLDTKAIIEISYNNQDWQKVIPPNATYSYTYYNAPRVSSISPPYGPVKSPNGERITLTGTNFNCPDTECKDLMVRFGDPQNGIFVKGTRTGPTTVECAVPKYTKPDVLPVEVTFNGQDFTNDNNTYGFFDPYVLDVQPRLIHARGSTRVRLYGFGFVNSTGTFLKTKFLSITRGNLTCNGDCIKMAEYIDKTIIESTTFQQQIVNFADNGENIAYNGLAVEACVYGSTFTDNGIEVFYYKEPIYQSLSQAGSPANFEKPIFAQTDFQWDVNDYDKFRKYSNFTCRFKSSTTDRIVVTKGQMTVYPLGNENENALPTHLKCNSPKWGNPEQVKLDFSVNGQDYAGDYTYTFYDNLDLYRIYPMAGPNEGSTKVLLFGSGFSSTREDVFVKWGILYTEQLVKEQVMNYVWNETLLIQTEAEKGDMTLKAYKEETYNEIEYYTSRRRDYELFEGQKLVTYYASSPRLSNWNFTHGGPIYMSVGEQLSLNITNYTVDESGPVAVTNVSYYEKLLYVYSFSYVEYYYYQNPVIKKVEPNTGLQKGGTRLEVSGAWFKYKPEYGIVPHCKIGDKISRAQFHSTVRIVCLTPPNEIVDTLLPVLVSLNGFDFVDTGFKFQYQIQTDLSGFYPTSGEEGSVIFIKGSKFMKFSGNSKYKCRFTDIEGNLPPKYEYIYYKDNTTVQCNAPKGFGQGLATRLQLTFNGDDYSDNNFTYFLYKINGVFPNSGPSDGSGGPILIIGDGFRNDPQEMNISCRLNGTEFAPIKIENKVIQCPVAPANKGETLPTRVDFVLQIDSSIKKQDNGFWYYEQIIAEGMEPNIGPSVGQGIINFYVQGLNASYDYFWANPGCKVGNSQGKGTIVGPVEIQQEGALVGATLIQCIIEEMDLVDKDYYLPATVALNSYSWVPTDFKYVPYGILDILPNSGPIQGNTEVIIIGKGFNEDLQEKAFCRFGVGASQAIVQADIIDYEQMLCKTPPGFQFPSYAELPVSVPLSITLSDKEQFNPWTESAHRFTFYQPPKIIRAEPYEIEIGKTQEITVFCDEDSEFLQPIPTYKDKRPQFDILCRFGRFKDGVGTFLNKTAIKCSVPTIKDDPDSIWREVVSISIAQNGKDFDDDFTEAEVTFVGTGSPLGFWSAILATLLIGLLIIAICFYCGAWIESWKRPNEIRNKDRSYVIRDAYDQFTSRAYTNGMMGSRASGDVPQ